MALDLGPAAARRLRQVAAATAAGGGSLSSANGGPDAHDLDSESLPGGPPAPLLPLTEAQLQGYVENGFVALPVAVAIAVTAI